MSGPTFSYEPEQPAPGAAASGLRPPPRPPMLHERSGFLAALTAPRLFYALAFLCSAVLLWIRFNPTFGHIDYGLLGRRTPLNVFRDAAGNWDVTWVLAQRAVVYLALLMIGYLVLTCWRSGRRRGAIALFFSLIVLATRPPAPSEINIVLLVVSSAAMAGALFIPQERATVWTRRVFWISFLTLLAVLWMPNRVVDPVLDAGYQSVGLEAVRAWMSPPETTFYGEPIEGFFDRIKFLFLFTIPQTSALLLSVVGLLAAIGLKGGWIRGLALLFLLVLVVGSSVAETWNAWIESRIESLSPWENGLTVLGEFWYDQFTIHALPLAGAIHDLTARRSP